MQPSNVTYPFEVCFDTPSTGFTLPSSGTVPTSFTTITLDDDKANSSRVPLQEAQGSKLSKRQQKLQKLQKKQKKQQRALMLASANSKDAMTTIVAPDFHSKLVTAPLIIPQIAASTLPPPLSHKDAATLSIATSMARPSRQTTPVALPRTAAGLLTTTVGFFFYPMYYTFSHIPHIQGRYHEIAVLNDLAPSALFNVIGVVIQVSPPGITRTGGVYVFLHAMFLMFNSQQSGVATSASSILVTLKLKIPMVSEASGSIALPGNTHSGSLAPALEKFSLCGISK